MKSGSSKNIIDLVVSICMYGVSVLVFVLTSSFRPSIDGSLGPAVWPRILAVLLFVVATIQLINVLRGKVKTEVHIDNPKEVVIACVLIVAYGLLLKPVGYIVMTAILLISLLWLFHERKPLVMILTPVIVIALSYYLFHSLLRVPLPDGILEPLLK